MCKASFAQHKFKDSPKLLTAIVFVFLYKAPKSPII